MKNALDIHAARLLVVIFQWHRRTYLQFHLQSFRAFGWNYKMIWLRPRWNDQTFIAKLHASRIWPWIRNPKFVLPWRAHSCDPRAPCLAINHLQQKQVCIGIGILLWLNINVFQAAQRYVCHQIDWSCITKFATEGVSRCHNLLFAILALARSLVSLYQDLKTFRSLFQGHVGKNVSPNPEHTALWIKRCDSCHARYGRLFVPLLSWSNPSQGALIHNTET